MYLGKMGVLISGGFPSEIQVNLYNLQTKETCILSDLPNQRWGHSCVGGVICGGGPHTEQQASCTYWNNGSWNFAGMGYMPSRFGHVTWNINPGESFMVLGAYWNNEFKRAVSIPVYENISLVKRVDWELQYAARYNALLIEFNFKYNNKLYCRFACSIEVIEEDSLIITGGNFDWGATSRVTKYDKFGNFSDMPLMNNGRGQHACGSYLNGNNQRV